MQKLNLQKEREFLASVCAETMELTEEQKWSLADKLAQPLKESMIKSLKEDVELITEAIAALKKPGVKWDLSDFLGSLQGIAKSIQEVERRAKKDLNYN